MRIEITNCRNIDTAIISLIDNKVNIKYAINGTGKSTIAKVIELASKEMPLDELTPFKHLANNSGSAPEINGITKDTSVLVFNESYMNQFTFQKEELVSNSFNIFVKTTDYDKHMEQIENLLSDIKKTFQADENIIQIIADLSTFIDSFGKAASGYSAAGALAKGIGNGNKIEHIPSELTGYTDFIKSEKKVPWLGWQLKGNDFLKLSSKCPFCTSEVEDKKQTITKVSVHYKAKEIEHLSNILSVIEKLGRYFSQETNTRFCELSIKADKLNKEEIEYLIQVKQQAIILRDKLSELRYISFFNMKDVDKVVELIDRLNIDINFLPHFNSEYTSSIVAKITDSLNQILKKAGQLQGEVNLQKRTIEQAIRENSSQINTFLLSAGYMYQVSIDFENNEYRMKLRHLDYNKPIENGDQYLSFGERNALAIVLFMYEALSKKVDLVILDDPISSFDKNKKYAIIDMLFGKNKGLSGKTVLLLTHDFEPIIDLMYTLWRQFSNKVVASFLELNKGVVIEKEIKKNDIKSFFEICKKNISDSPIEIVKLIHLRRLYEINDNKGIPYELLSNLFHKRLVPIKYIEDNEVNLTSEEIDKAVIEINTYVNSFSYQSILELINNVVLLKDLYMQSDCNFEKLELFRIITGEAMGNSVLCKYINETFHIENDYVMQLNPLEFQVIPYFIIDQCDKELGI